MELWFEIGKFIFIVFTSVIFLWFMSQYNFKWIDITNNEINTLLTLFIIDVIGLFLMLIFYKRNNE